MSGFAGYDESLLASAPVATKSQIQSGYSIDLLREKKRPPPRRQNLDGAESTTPAVPFRSRPFYRRKRAIIIIIIGFFALLAVIIGAVVGSKIKKKSSDKGQSTSNSGSNSGQNNSGQSTTSTSTTLNSRTFTWTSTPPGSGPTVITSVFPPGVGINEPTTSSTVDPQATPTA